MPADGFPNTAATAPEQKKSGITPTEFKMHEGSVPLQLQLPHQYHSQLPKTVLRVDDDQYDLTAWRYKHPGGAQLLDLFHGKDATDAFYALHSKDAIRQLKRMPKKPVTDEEIPRDKFSRDFETFRQKLEAEGWFHRPWLNEMIRYVIPTFALLIFGWLLSASHPVLATFMLGLGMQQAGWLGHDWSHGRDRVPMALGKIVAGVSNGFSNGWWSNKHNTHHVFPNRLGIDSDVHNEPVLHLWKPSDSQDKWWRHYQHLFFVGAYSFLYVSWKQQSIHFALTKGDWMERIPILIHYSLMLMMPWYVALGAVMLAGLFVAVVVTVNHQVEPMIETEDKYNYAMDQFISTRGVVCPDFFTEFFFGGMQYQLEHHLFPIMPRARYQALRPLVTKWAEEHGVEHKLAGIVDIVKMNYDLIVRASKDKVN